MEILVEAKCIFQKSMASNSQQPQVTKNEMIGQIWSSHTTLFGMYAMYRVKLVLAARMSNSVRRRSVPQTIILIALVGLDFLRIARMTTFLWRLVNSLLD